MLVIAFSNVSALATGNKESDPIGLNCMLMCEDPRMQSSTHLNFALYVKCLSFLHFLSHFFALVYLFSLYHFIPYFFPFVSVSLFFLLSSFLLFLQSKCLAIPFPSQRYSHPLEKMPTLKMAAL